MRYKKLLGTVSVLSFFCQSALCFAGKDDPEEQQFETHQAATPAAAEAELFEDGGEGSGSGSGAGSFERSLIEEWCQNTGLTGSGAFVEGNVFVLDNLNHWYASRDAYWDEQLHPTRQSAVREVSAAAGPSA